MLTTVVLALDEATWVNVALVTVTALLTLATFVLAKRAKAQAKAARDQADAAEDQAKATAELVAIARRDLAATATPHLIPIAPLGEVTGGRADDERTVVVNVRNLGGANAEYQSSTLALIYGGEVMRGRLLAHGPIIQPDEQVSIQFVGNEDLPSGGQGLLEISYQGPGSGTQRAARISVSWDGQSLSVGRTEQGT
jgi:hypothetical protein